MIFVSRCGVIAYGIMSGVLAILLLKIGLSLGWVYLFMGVCVGSAVMPVAFAITWANCSGMGAVAGAVGGLICALAAWCAASGLELGS
jgi:Na+/proline symporter